MQELEWAYLAGVFDGEGSISLSKSGGHGANKTGASWRTEVRISSTDKVLVDWIQTRIFGAVRTSNHGKSLNSANCKDVYQWSLYESNALVFLEGILPFLVIKRPRVMLALEFLRYTRAGAQLDKIHQERRQQIIEELHILNKRGMK